jgi:DNA-directed RNA polymerase subunit RPC12/RpoP
MSIRCPKCNSDQITAHKKGFSGRKAVAGAVLTGGIGVLAGTIGSNKVKITCLNCGNIFNPGERRRTTAATTSPAKEKKNEEDATLGIIFFVLAVLFGLYLMYS